MRLLTFQASRRVAVMICNVAMAGLLVMAVDSTFGQIRPSPVSPQDRAALVQARAFHEAGNLSEASIILERLAAKSPPSAVGTEAKILLANIRLKQEAYKEVVALLIDVLDHEPGTESVDRARMDLAAAYVALGNPKRAIPLLDDVASSKAPTGMRRQAYDLLVPLVVQQGDPLRGIRLLLEESTLPAEAVDQTLLQTHIHEIVGSVQDPALMEALAERFPDRFPGDLGLLRAAQLYGERGEPFHQDRLLQRLVAAFPRHERLADVRAQLEENRARLRAFRYVIGLPLPFQGALQPYADSILRGAQLAVTNAQVGLSEPLVGLVVKDYGGDPSRLGMVVDDMVRDPRCLAIVGPLLSREMEILLPRAQRARVPMVSPTATGPLSPHRYLFRTALTAGVEGSAVAGFAMEQLGLQRFVVLAPNDRYHAEVVAAFSEAITRQGGRITFSETYEPSAVDFKREIVSLKEQDLAREGQMVPPEPPSVSAPPGSAPPQPTYVPGFDAVFLPGDGETVGLLAAQLAFYDVAVPLLGTSGWNGRELIKSGGRHVEGGIFVDAFFPNAPEPAVQQFVKQYRARYRDEPDQFAAQAYDAASLLIQALKAGGTSGDRLRDELVKINGYRGVSGLTGVNLEGEAQRRLSWIQVKNGRFVPAL